MLRCRLNAIIKIPKYCDLSMTCITFVNYFLGQALLLYHFDVASLHTRQNAVPQVIRFVRLCAG